ncbi:MAG: tetratricopeptide repeat protein [Longimicrobiales bacterium]
MATSVYLRREQYSRAEPLFQEALRTNAQTLPADHLNVRITQVKLGRTLRGRHGGWRRNHNFWPDTRSWPSCRIRA